MAYVISKKLFQYHQLSPIGYTEIPRPFQTQNCRLIIYTLIKRFIFFQFLWYFEFYADWINKPMIIFF